MCLHCIIVLKRMMSRNFVFLWMRFNFFSTVATEHLISTVEIKCNNDLTKIGSHSNCDELKKRRLKWIYLYLNVLELHNAHGCSKCTKSSWFSSYLSLSTYSESFAVILFILLVVLFTKQSYSCHCWMKSVIIQRCSGVVFVWFCI